MIAPKPDNAEYLNGRQLDNAPNGSVRTFTLEAVVVSAVKRRGKWELISRRLASEALSGSPSIAVSANQVVR